jgi:hypothetical protein
LSREPRDIGVARTAQELSKTYARIGKDRSGDFAHSYRLHAPRHGCLGTGHRKACCLTCEQRLVCTTAGDEIIPADEQALT